MLFEPVRQIRVSHAMFKVISFVEFGSFIKSSNALQYYIYQLRDQLTDEVTNTRHKFIEDDLSKVTD